MPSSTDKSLYFQKNFSGLSEKDLKHFNDFYRKNEADAVANLLGQNRQTDEQAINIAKRALQFVEEVRKHPPSSLGFENFLTLYGLNSKEGLALMSLAEALLRMPDKYTSNLLVRDKLGSVNWNKKREQKKPFLAKIVAFGLGVADRLTHFGLEKQGFLEVLGELTRRVSDPLIRQIILKAMKVLAQQFVMEKTIARAIKKSAEGKNARYLYSYDMLGEEACTQEDANRYFKAYEEAITVAGAAKITGTIFSQPSISIKLSALHPRYELSQRNRIYKELLPRILHLAILAKDQGIGLTLDAEESERLELSLDMLQSISKHDDLKGWNGLGIAVQTYQKRSAEVIDYLITLAKSHERRLCLRLVKGAYWDSEIKRTQEKGLKDYAVYTRKVYTDLSYLVCAQKMLASPEQIYSQFATHNAHTLASILEYAGSFTDFEFQRLYGMGEVLYDQIVSTSFGIACRIYAPIGEYNELLPYLVRRMLENGANTSFVHKIQDVSIPPEEFTKDPVQQTVAFQVTPNPKIVLPENLFAPLRLNSSGIDLNNSADINELYQKIEKRTGSDTWTSAPLINGKQQCLVKATPILNPANGENVGQSWEASPDLAIQALEQANLAFAKWSNTPVETRANILETLSTLLENNREELMELLVREGGKTLPDALGEVREAVDFCRYYASEARRLMTQPQILVGITGELNELGLHGMGVFVCISPWNFPLSIFLGQIMAALVTGNCVIAKPAHQTPLVAYKTIQLAYQAGIPKSVLYYLPGKGSNLGSKILAHPLVAGVAFTGSTEVAQSIAKTLVSRPNTPLVPLIAETGGMNAMIVDSSALMEQVIHSTIISAFHSAGQRCSALRLLFIQEDIADNFLTMLEGAMSELSVGNPLYLATDVGPVIDAATANNLRNYEKQMEHQGQLVYRVPLPDECLKGNFIAPQAWEIPDAKLMTKEIFGPILHIVRFKGNNLTGVINDINASGYGLTLGVHSRIGETVNQVRKYARVGNLYVNRPMTGAVVGVQPFGGEGLSGTGPKAGGPNYLTRFTVERTFSQDTTAAGGNASLLGEDE